MTEEFKPQTPREAEIAAEGDHYKAKVHKLEELLAKLMESSIDSNNEKSRLQKVIQNLAMLTRQTLRHVPKENSLYEKTRGFLQRSHLDGEILRDDTVTDSFETAKPDRVSRIAAHIMNLSWTHGDDAEDRHERYGQIQEVLEEELPYSLVFSAEKAEELLRVRDRFIVDAGLWMTFVETLPYKNTLSPAKEELCEDEGRYDLVYRPNEFDDWGIIRKKDGEIFAVVKRPCGEEELARHRADGTDPYEFLARALMTASEAKAVPVAGQSGEAVRDALRKIATMSWHQNSVLEMQGIARAALASVPAPAKEELCEDEGCPHFGIPHVCNPVYESNVSNATLAQMAMCQVAWIEEGKMEHPYRLKTIRDALDRLNSTLPEDAVLKRELDEESALRVGAIERMKEAELKRDQLIAVISRIKFRLHFMDWPAEPMWNVGTEESPVWKPDWRYEINLIENALNGTEMIYPEKPTDTVPANSLPKKEDIKLPFGLNVEDEIPTSLTFGEGTSATAMLESGCTIRSALAVIYGMKMLP